MAVAQKTRYRWLDILRGAAVVNMVAFHFCYDWFEVFARQPAGTSSGPAAFGSRPSAAPSSSPPGSPLISAAGPCATASS